MHSPHPPCVRAELGPVGIAKVAHSGRLFPVALVPPLTNCPCTHHRLLRTASQPAWPSTTLRLTALGTDAHLETAKQFAATTQRSSVRDDNRHTGCTEGQGRAGDGQRCCWGRGTPVFAKWCWHQGAVLCSRTAHVCCVQGTYCAALARLGRTASLDPPRVLVLCSTPSSTPQASATSWLCVIR